MNSSQLTGKPRPARPTYHSIVVYICICLCLSDLALQTRFSSSAGTRDQTRCAKKKKAKIRVRATSWSEQLAFHNAAEILRQHQKHGSAIE